MAILTIEPWKVKGSKDQRSTRWEFTDDEEGLVRIKNVVTTGDEMFILKDIGVYPDKKIIYVRPVRVFDTSEIPLTRTAIPMSINLTNNTLFRDGANVKEPLVFIDEDEYNDASLPDFTFFTSEFFSTQDEHEASNWIISDADGNVILSYLRNRFNKTRLRVSKEKLKSYSYFKIQVQHVTSTGMESSFGVLEVYKNNGEQFQVLKEVSNVNPDEDFHLYLSPASVFTSNIIVGIYLRTLNNSAGDLEKITIPTPSSNPIVIPNRYLKNDSTYYVDIFSKDSTNNLIKTTVTLETIKTEDLPEEAFDGKLEKVGDYSNLNLVKSFCYDDYILGNFLSPLKNSSTVKVNTIRQFSTINGLEFRLTVGTQYRQDVSVPTNANDNIFARINKGYLVIDTLDDNSKPMFMSYKYNKITDEFTIIGQLKREETLPLGYDNNAFFYNDKLYYKINNSKKIMAYDYASNTLEEIVEVPDELIEATLIFNPIYNKVMLSCRDGFFRVLDLKTLTIESGSAIEFSFQGGERLKSILLPNGDSLVINISLTNEIIEIGHYNAKDSTFTMKDITGLDFKKHSGYINTLFNSVFLLQSEDDTDVNQQLYRYY